MCALVYIGAFKTVSICMKEGSLKEDNEINCRRRREAVGQKAGVAPDHQNRVQEMKNEEAEACHRSQPTSPGLSLQVHSQTSDCLSSCFPSNVIPCKRSSTSHFVPLFSHCLMALVPAMLPWEPEEDSRCPLHLFPFIPF